MIVVALCSAIAGGLALRPSAGTSAGRSRPLPTATAPVIEPSASITDAAIQAEPPVATQVWPTIPPSSHCAPVASDLAADLDGDGCAEEVTFRDGILQAGTARYALGRPGDVVGTGDWDCDGRDTVALLRPGTGEVFVFDGWATPAQPLVGRLAGRVAGAVALGNLDADGNGCAELFATRAEGSSLAVTGAKRP